MWLPQVNTGNMWCKCKQQGTCLFGPHNGSLDGSDTELDLEKSCWLSRNSQRQEILENVLMGGSLNSFTVTAIHVSSMIQPKKNK